MHRIGKRREAGGWHQQRPSWIEYMKSISKDVKKDLASEDNRRFGHLSSSQRRTQRRHSRHIVSMVAGKQVDYFCCQIRKIITAAPVLNVERLSDSNRDPGQDFIDAMHRLSTSKFPEWWSLVQEHFHKTSTVWGFDANDQYYRLMKLDMKHRAKFFDWIDWTASNGSPEDKRESSMRGARLDKQTFLITKFINDPSILTIMQPADHDQAKEIWEHCVTEQDSDNISRRTPSGTRHSH